MPSYTLLTPADCRRVPWKNGLGTTTEIAVEALNADRFLWRVSIADVAAPGTFSTFTGYDRLIAVIEGGGMTLSVNGGAPVARRRMEPAFAFPGEAAVDCALLDGPIRDFNLMLDRATATGAVTLLSGGDCLAAGDVVLVHALSGTTRARPADGDAIPVPPGHSLLLRGVATALVSAPDGAEAVVAEIRRRESRVESGVAT